MKSHSELFKYIETMVPQIEGWCSVERACELAAAILALRPVASVSIGVWGGRDTLSMAAAHKFLKWGYVLAIDPFSAEASIAGEEEANKAHWGRQDMHERVCEAFKANVVLHGLDNYVKFERKESDYVMPPEGAMVVAIDGNHSAQAIRDTERFVLPLAIGSIVYFDDIGWSSGAVKKSVVMAEAAGFVRQFDRDTGAFFRRADYPVDL